MVLYLGNSQKERQLDQVAFLPNADSEKQSMQSSRLG